MAILTHCPHCNLEYRLRDDAPVGAEVICTECRRSFALQAKPPESVVTYSESGEWARLLAALLLLTLVVATSLFLLSRYSRQSRPTMSQTPGPSRLRTSPLVIQPRVTQPRKTIDQPHSSLPVEEELRNRQATQAAPVPLSETTPAQDKFRIVIDASKGGGSWWFPQGKDFDANLPHQGKAAADLLRTKGWRVDELPRGERITTDTLAGANVIVRLAPFSAYSVAEANVFQQKVAAGATLVLIGDGRQPRDPIARTFGFGFGERTIIGEVARWQPHPLSQTADCLQGPWTTIIRMPADAIELAWLEQGPTQEVRPVLGYLPYGDGLVIFTGARLHRNQQGRKFLTELITAVEQLPHDKLMQRPSEDSLFRPTEDVSPAPRLLIPQPEATLPQPDDGPWNFEWEAVAGTDSYELVVLGPHAGTPLVRRTLQETRYTKPSRGGYIIDRNRRGWSWRVRALNKGTPGIWSDVRTFDVASRHQ